MLTGYMASATKIVSIGFVILLEVFIPCTCVPHQKPCSYEKGPLPISPYCGFETPRCHLVLYQRTREDVAYILDGSCGDFRDELKESSGTVIVYCEEASDELYHFILPLRAHQLSAKDLKPIIFMLGNE